MRGENIDDDEKEKKIQSLKLGEGIKLKVLIAPKEELIFN
jgi:hypothetical protein